MTYEEAKAKLIEMADGRYCSLEKEEVINAELIKDPVICRVFVSGGGSKSGKTWEKVLRSMAKRLKESEP